MATGTAVSFSALDWAVVAAYFVVIAGIAIWVALGKEKDTEDYFLASRDAGWFLIGASIFASNIGAEHLVGLAGTGAGSGMAFAHWELHSYLCVVLGWVFAPFYLRSGVFTTPEFLEKRYTPATRMVLSLVSMVAYVLTKASVTIYAGAVAISTILGYPTGSAIDLPLLGPTDFFWFAAFSLVIVTGVYTVTGGMKAVLWTEGLQAPLLLIGSLIILVAGLAQIGGLDGLRAANPETIHLWRPLSTTPETQGFPGFLFDPSETPWLGVMLASPIIGLWYWCTDQYIVQRVLTAKNLKEARRGTLWAGYLKLFPLFIFLIPGMIAVALKQQGVAGFADMTRPDEAFPRLVSHLLPAGLRGLVLAGMLAALMSSLASLFNSTATLFTVDVYKRLRPRAGEAHLVNVGRLATVAVVGARHGLDPVPADARQRLALRLPAAGAVAAGPGDCGGVPARHRQRNGHADRRPGRARRRVPARHGPARAHRRQRFRRAIRAAGQRLRRAELALLQLLPVRIHLCPHRRREPVDTRRTRRPAGQPDDAHGDARTAGPRTR